MADSYFGPFRSYRHRSRRVCRESLFRRLAAVEQLEDRRLLATHVLDFNHLPYNSTIGSTVAEDGFLLTGVGGPIATKGTNWSSTQGVTLYQYSVNANVQLSRQDGGDFRFVSIDLNSLNGYQPAYVPFTADLASGGTSEFARTTDSNFVTFQEFAAPITDPLTELTWQQVDQGGPSTDFHQFDRIVLEVGASVVEFGEPDLNVEYAPISSLDVTFNETIDLTSFTYEDLTLILDSETVALDDSVTISHVSGSTYRIDGLSAFTTDRGDYSLTITALDILSPSGLQGMGSESLTWSHIAPLTISTSLPLLDEGTVPLGLTSLDLGFTYEADGADLPENFELRRAGSDALLGTADDLIVPLEVSYSGLTATLTFDGLAEDLYRLRVRDTITDTQGNALDGDEDEHFGGDWVRDFTVGTFTASLGTPNNDELVVAHAGYGIGQLVHSSGNAFDGVGRLVVDGETVSTDPEWLPTAVTSETHQGYSINQSLTSDWADVPALVETITLNEASVVDLNASVSAYASTAYSRFELRVLVNGIPLPAQRYYTGYTVDFQRLLSLAAGTYDIQVQARGISSGVSIASLGSAPGEHIVHALRLIATPATSTVTSETHVGYSSNQSLTGLWANIPALADSIILAEESVLDLNASVSAYSSTANARFELRFLIDGVPLLPQRFYAGYTVDHHHLVTLEPGTYAIQVQARDIAGGVSVASLGTPDDDHVVHALRMIATPSAVTSSFETHVGYSANQNLTGSWANIPALQRTVALAEESVIDLNAAVSAYSSTPNSRYEVRVVVDGVPLLAQRYYADYTADFQRLLTLGPGEHNIQIQARDIYGGVSIASLGSAAGDHSVHALHLRVHAPRTVANLDDDGETYSSPNTQFSSGLTVIREVTVPQTGDHDFARTIDTFGNPTAAPISTTVRIAGNLGSDGETTVFNTASGDLAVDASDMWIGTDDADGAGTPAIIHFIHGPLGLVPSGVQVVADNIFWEYDLTLAPGETVRLAYFTVLAETRLEAEAAAAALVTTSGFGGQATADLTPQEIGSLANFGFNTPPWAEDDEVETDQDTSIVINVLADNGHGTDGDNENNLDVSLTAVTAPPTRGSLTNHGDSTFTFAPGNDFDFLAAGQSTPETFTYRVEDELGETATAVVTITVQGTNDTAVISGTADTDIDEDKTVPTTGQLLVTDPDSGESLFTAQAEVAGLYGTFALAEVGNWTYTLNTNTVQHLNLSDSVQDSFVIESVDGTATQQVVITVNGLNDAPVPTIDSMSSLRVVGNAIQVSASATDVDSSLQTLTYKYEVFQNGGSNPWDEAQGIDLTEFEFLPDAAGEYRLVVNVTDEEGEVGMVEQTIIVGDASSVEFIFSKDGATVGAIDNNDPGTEAVFHEWEEATGQVWITIDSDLPAQPFDLTFQLSSSGTWFEDPQLQSSLSATSHWQTGDDGGVRVTTGTLEGLNLSGFQVGDRVLLATVAWPHDPANGAGVPMSEEGAYPVTNNEHGVQLDSAAIADTGQVLAIAAETGGQFAPVIYDVDDSGRVGLSDFSRFVSQFARTVNAESPQSYQVDYDRDGRVGLSDFVLFVQHFGRRKDAGNVPVTMPYLDSQPETQNRTLSLESEPQPSLALALEAEPVSSRLLGYQPEPYSLAENTFHVSRSDASQTPGEVHPASPPPALIDAAVLDALLQASDENLVDYIDGEEDDQFNYIADDELLEHLL